MTLRRTLRSEAGVTFIAAIVMVVIMGIMLAQAAVVWKTTMQRERETELLFRGAQIRVAMQRYYLGKALQRTVLGAPQQVPQPLPGRPNLKELKDLLQDPGSTAKVRYLRPVNLIDPITGKEWALVKDGSQRIVGVKSTSDDEPLKKGNFPDEFIDFEGKTKYSEWEFIYNRIPQPGAKAGTVTGLPPGSVNPGTSGNPGTFGNPLTR